MRRRVGFAVLEAVLAPVLDVQEPALFDGTEGDSEPKLRKVLRDYVKPYYESFDQDSRDAIDDSVLYLSRFAPTLPVVPLDALPTPFEIKQELSVFCRWLAEELGVRDRSIGRDEFEYSADLSMVHRLLRKR